ncbi:hypothetical protein TNCV_750491 [Trichonephila clavipes]|nr:hypothetical protein TNCV_750491 [Trichonephila clavipes]
MFSLYGISVAEAHSGDLMTTAHNTLRIGRTLQLFHWTSYDWKRFSPLGVRVALSNKKRMMIGRQSLKTMKRHVSTRDFQAHGASSMV